MKRKTMNAVFAWIDRALSLNVARDEIVGFISYWAEQAAQVGDERAFCLLSEDLEIVKG